MGISRSKGAYLGFLDDDDDWCDERHLEVAYEVLTSFPDIDVYLADQKAVRGDEVVVSPWLPSVHALARHRPALGTSGVRKLERRDVLQPGGIGFPHVNVCIAKRGLVDAIGGFWEVENEEDLGFFLRLADAAASFAYRPDAVAMQRLRPLGVDKVNEVDRLRKRLLRILTCQHAEALSRSPEARAYARVLHSGVLKTMAKEHYRKGDWSLAAGLARRAAAVDPSIRWRLIAFALGLKAAFGA